MLDNWFVIGSGRPSTPVDLARLEAEVRELQAEVDRASAVAAVVPPPEDDPRMRTLPEQLERLERSLAEQQAKLDETRAAAAALELEIDQAAGSSPERLESLREALSEAQGRIEKTERRVAAVRNMVDNGRQTLPEDAQAEALARTAHAEHQLAVRQRMLDWARADLMPEDCRDALELLAFHAADEWLERHGPADVTRRMGFRREVAMNIRARLAIVMFSPNLTELDRLRQITGTQKSRGESAGGGGGS